jgi:hypothetical protein
MLNKILLFQEDSKPLYVVKVITLEFIILELMPAFIKASSMSRISEWNSQLFTLMGRIRMENKIILIKVSNVI